MSLILRPESTADIPVIHALTKTAFLQAPHAAHTEYAIVDALRDQGALFISLVAGKEGVLVGHVALSPVTVSSGAGDWYALGPLSVAPGNRRQGIGSKLVTEALRRLHAHGACGCVLVGNPAYYARFGFQHQHHLIYPGLAPEYFQVLAFSPSLPHGVVEFHNAFKAQGEPVLFCLFAHQRLDQNQINRYNFRLLKPSSSATAAHIVFLYAALAVLYRAFCRLSPMFKPARCCDTPGRSAFPHRPFLLQAA